MTKIPIIVAAAAALVAIPSVSDAESPVPQAMQHVTYQGYDLQVPASWRVVNLDQDPQACVIFDTSTVYVGRAGSQQNCPAHAVGGAPSLWIQPLDDTTQLGDARILDTGAAVTTEPDTSGESTVVVRAASVVVSSFGGAGAAGVLETASLTADARPSTMSVSANEIEPMAMVEVPGSFRGRGFDACTAPGGKAMHAWKEHSNFRAVGVYIGGVSRACAQPKLTAEWVRKRTAGHWHVLPIYVGLQAPCAGFEHGMSNDPATARKQGRRAAGAAINDAKSLAIGSRSVIYYDIEGYKDDNARCRRAVLSFLTGWTNQLHRNDYRSGVYSSISSGIEDLSETYRSDRFARPNHIWAAWWNGERNVDFKPYVPDRKWDQRQRVHQYKGGHDETHGGYTINIDSNYMRIH